MYAFKVYIQISEQMKIVLIGEKRVNKYFSMLQIIFIFQQILEMISTKYCLTLIYDICCLPQLACLMMYYDSLYCKHYGPWSDCS